MIRYHEVFFPIYVYILSPQGTPIDFFIEALNFQRSKILSYNHHNLGSCLNVRITTLEDRTEKRFDKPMVVYGDYEYAVPALTRRSSPPRSCSSRWKIISNRRSSTS